MYNKNIENLAWCGLVHCAGMCIWYNTTIGIILQVYIIANVS